MRLAPSHSLCIRRAFGERQTLDIDAVRLRAAPVLPSLPRIVENHLSQDPEAIRIVGRGRRIVELESPLRPPAVLRQRPAAGHSIDLHVLPGGHAGFVVVAWRVFDDEPPLDSDWRQATYRRSPSWRLGHFARVNDLLIEG